MKTILMAIALVTLGSSQANAKCCVSEYFCDYPNEGVESSTIVKGRGFSCSVSGDIERCERAGGVMIDNSGRCVDFTNED